MTTHRTPRGRSANHAEYARVNRQPDDELLTIRDMCAELKISRRTFYRWNAAGDVPELIPTPGGHFRAHRSDYQAWLLDRAEKEAGR